ncbi:ABC transporter permease [Natrinema salaciae]|uniref:Peptide/nickel transport system permease protein n=1 Tax=Natrinema salaciae TaxID=1186196 RepID=A0A1H9JXG8_9EURY|nr:ABC transporter permease [Natrinema salaciae]SEQ91453.1 peptide/nickel transport system permease protein [Natrinema salaciae]
MNWYLKRTGQALFTLWAVVTIAFVLAWNVPGSLVDHMVDRIVQNSNIDPEVVRQSIESRLMFDPDASVVEAYVTYMSALLDGNLGYSFVAGQDVTATLSEAVPWTLLVMSLATLGMFAVSLALGAIMAYREGSWFDLVNTFVGIVTTSIPYFVAAFLLILWVGHSDAPILELFPPRGRQPPRVDPGFTLAFVGGALRHATLPALSYIVTGYGLLALSMRGNSIQTLGEDYVRVAELRGLSSRRIALRYVGRNAILPLYTSLLLSIGFMLGSSVVLEQIFQYHGVGYWMYEAIDANDIPLMMGTFIVITVCVVIATFVADMTYSMLDPRIKSGEQGEAY